MDTGPYTGYIISRAATFGCFKGSDFGGDFRANLRTFVFLINKKKTTFFPNLFVAYFFDGAAAHSFEHHNLYAAIIRVHQSPRSAIRSQNRSLSLDKMNW